MTIERFGWGLLALALVGGTASLFGPSAPVWGLDLGTAGTVLFSLTLWAGAWLLARHPGRVFSPDWPVAERRAWAGLLFLLLMLLNYLRYMWALSLQEVPQSISQTPSKHFMFNMTVLCIAWALVAKTIRADPSNAVDFDERDGKIQHSADRASDLTFTLIAVVCFFLLVTVPAQQLQWWLAPLITAHILIGLLLVKELSQYLYLVVSYARERH